LGLSDKAEAVKELAITGAAIGSLAGPVGGLAGGGIGATLGLLVGDETTVFPLDMIAIPAYQAYMLAGTPALTIYIKAGETLVPTGGNVQDMAEGLMQAEVIEDTMVTPTKRKRAKGAGLPKKYAKMGFKKGWREYKKTATYKNKQKRKGRKK
jgi:hypothetical protein